jgi:hypothetical protein
VITITVDNLDPSAVVSLDDLVLTDVEYIDQTTIRFTIPEGIWPGEHWIWVENPGGYRAAARLQLGRSLFLPTVQRR